MSVFATEWEELMKSLAVPSDYVSKQSSDTPPRRSSPGLAWKQTASWEMKPSLSGDAGIDSLPVPTRFSRDYPLARNTQTRSPCSKMKEAEDLPVVDTLSPIKRSRVFTWGSTMSDSGCSEISTVSFNNAICPTSIPVCSVDERRDDGSSGFEEYKEGPVRHIRGSAAARRRFTCPRAMRSFNRRKDNDAGSKGLEQLILDEMESDISDDVQGKDTLWESPMESDCSSVAFSRISSSIELLILRQPESHHRARYQKEGSRGCIKDRTGNSCPCIQLKRYNGPSAVLQVFIGTETGPMRPHPLYRVCKVGGKHCTPCRERFIEPNIHSFEMDFLRETGYIINVDCLGIMKLRNADFELMSDAENLSKRRKQSPKVRLVFRAIFQQMDGCAETLQVVSSPISCTPSPGMPEIHFISHSSCSSNGGLNIALIGRNFVKDDSRIFVMEKDLDDEVIWELEVKPLPENFNQVHLVGTMPPYRDPSITQPAENVFLYVRNRSGKRSELYPFRYTPDETTARLLTPPPYTSPPPILKRSRHGGSTSSLSTMDSSDQNFPYNTPSHSPSPYETNGKPTTTTTSCPHHTILPTPTSANNNSFQYHIGLPGSDQPLIITVSSGNQTATGSTVVQSVQNIPPGTITVDLRQIPPVKHEEPSGKSGTGKQEEASICSPPYSPPSASAPIVPGLDDTEGGATDDDVFNDLLKEILGMEDSAMDGLGYSMDYAASLAASSMSALDINLETFLNRPNNGSGR